MESDTVGKIREVLAKNQSSAVEPGLQGLRLHMQDRTRFLGREALNISKDHRNPIHLRQIRQRPEEAFAHFTAQHLIIGQRRPVRGFLNGSRRRIRRDVVGARLLGRARLAAGAQPRHRRVESDPVDPR